MSAKGAEALLRLVAESSQRLVAHDQRNMKQMISLEVTRLQFKGIIEISPGQGKILISSWLILFFQESAEGGVGLCC